MNSSLTFFSSSLFFLILFTAFSTSSCSSKLILQACKNSSAEDPNISFKFCTTSLQAAPGSKSADIRQLGKISITLIRRNVTNTRVQIKKMLKKSGEATKMDPFYKQCLKDCLVLYSGAIGDLKHAIKSYKLKHYDDVSIEISSVMDAATTCEDGFKEKEGLVSPLTGMNNNVAELSAISLSIISMVH